VDRNVNAILQTAKDIVLKAGKKACRIPPCSRGVLPDRDKDYGDIVTEGDLVVQDYVKERLQEEFPEHGFDSEEMDKENSKAEYTWVLDPIDGTKYYTRDVPFWTISLALKRYDKSILGVVYSPELNRLYCASIDGEATLNGEPIHCSNIERIEHASIYLELPSRYSPQNEQQWAMEKMGVLVEHAYRVRIIGVGSLGLCFCATGGFDAYVNLGSSSKPCDTAAGEVIVRKAGGEFFKTGKQIIAGRPELCGKIRAILDI